MNETQKIKSIAYRKVKKRRPIGKEEIVSRVNTINSQYFQILNSISNVLHVIPKSVANEEKSMKEKRSRIYKSKLNSSELTYNSKRKQLTID